jgi:DNA-binding Lrp family transcriptional regulator
VFKADMQELDETDQQILRMLVDDARRPFREIADVVDLSPPAVSDRVTRLQKQGVIRRFTTELDRSKLREGIPLLVRLTIDRENVDRVRQKTMEMEAVEHVYVTVEGNVFVHANAPRTVNSWLDSLLETVDVHEIHVDLLSESHWTPAIGSTDLALVCDECGNTVTTEGLTAKIGGDIKQFCCPSCESQFRERYERIQSETT